MLQAHMISRALHGHTSPETAYVVENYPYGFKLRCKIRYWLEYKPSKGWRFASQTTNPKLAGEVWNKPKCSTYAELAACMYLDYKGHVQWEGLNAYATTEQIGHFVGLFPAADLAAALYFATARARLCERYLAGTAHWTINGSPRPFSEYELAGFRAELDTLYSVLRTKAAA